MAITTLTEIYAANRQMFDTKLLVRALPRLVHDRYGQVRPIQSRSGDQIKFRRLEALTVPTGSITEGVTPDSTQASLTDVTATLLQYMGWVQYTDMLKWTNEVDMIKEFASLCGEQAGRKLDNECRDVLVAGSTLQRANGASRGAINTIIATDDLDVVIRTLQRNDARTFTPIIRASERVGTLGVRASFWGICHPDVYYTLRGLTGWQDVKDYSHSEQAVPGEVGTYRDIRFVMTSNARIWTGTGASGGSSVRETGGVADIYATLVFAQDSYGIVPLQVGGNYKGRNHEFDGNIGLIFKDLGSSGSEDPGNQRGSVAWKATTVFRILNDSFMARIESAATS